MSQKKFIYLFGFSILICKLAITSPAIAQRTQHSAPVYSNNVESEYAEEASQPNLAKKIVSYGSFAYGVIEMVVADIKRSHAMRELTNNEIALNHYTKIVNQSLALNALMEKVESSMPKSHEDVEDLTRDIKNLNHALENSEELSKFLRQQELGAHKLKNAAGPVLTQQLNNLKRLKEQTSHLTNKDLTKLLVVVDTLVDQKQALLALRANISAGKSATRLSQQNDKLTKTMSKATQRLAIGTALTAAGTLSLIHEFAKEANSSTSY